MTNLDLDHDTFSIAEFRMEYAKKRRKTADDAWPGWWGTGASPWDHIPVKGERKNLLFLTGELIVRSRSVADGVDYNDYLERMNTHTYEIVDGELFLEDRADCSGSAPSEYSGRCVGSRLGWI
jgi:hypothetical protein